MAHRAGAADRDVPVVSYEVKQLATLLETAQDALVALCDGVVGAGALQQSEPTTPAAASADLRQALTQAMLVDSTGALTALVISSPTLPYPETLLGRCQAARPNGGPGAETQQARSVPGATPDRTGADASQPSHPLVAALRLAVPFAGHAVPPAALVRSDSVDSSGVHAASAERWGRLTSSAFKLHSSDGTSPSPPAMLHGQDLAQCWFQCGGGAASTPLPGNCAAVLRAALLAGVPATDPFCAGNITVTHLAVLGGLRGCMEHMLQAEHLTPFSLLPLLDTTRTPKHPCGKFLHPSFMSLPLSLAAAVLTAEHGSPPSVLVPLNAAGPDPLQHIASAVEFCVRPEASPPFHGAPPGVCPQPMLGDMPLPGGGFADSPEPDAALPRRFSQAPLHRVAYDEANTPRLAEAEVRAGETHNTRQRRHRASLFHFLQVLQSRPLACALRIVQCSDSLRCGGAAQAALLSTLNEPTGVALAETAPALPMKVAYRFTPPGFGVRGPPTSLGTEIMRLLVQRIKDWWSAGHHLRESAASPASAAQDEPRLAASIIRQLCTAGATFDHTTLLAEVTTPGPDTFTLAGDLPPAPEDPQLAASMERARHLHGFIVHSFSTSSLGSSGIGLLTAAAFTWNVPRPPAQLEEHGLPPGMPKLTGLAPFEFVRPASTADLSGMFDVPLHQRLPVFLAPLLRAMLPSVLRELPEFPPVILDVWSRDAAQGQQGFGCAPFLQCLGWERRRDALLFRKVHKA